MAATVLSIVGLTFDSYVVDSKLEYRLRKLFFFSE